MLNQIINGVMGEMDLQQNQVEGGIGLLLNTAKEKLSDTDYSEVTNALGGDVSNLLEAAPSGSGGGFGSSIMGMASSALGGNADLGSLAGLASGFKDLNMDMDTMMKFVPLVINLVKTNGNEVVSGLLEKVLK